MLVADIVAPVPNALSVCQMVERRGPDYPQLRGAR